MEYTFLNEQKHYEMLLAIFMGVLEDHEATDYEWFAEQEAESLAASHVKDMAKYVHQSDTKIWGNFANIREDWDYIPDFVRSEVKPWGRFDDVVKSIDDKTISEEDLAKFQEWCSDWFFTAFGTRNLEYNFATDISEISYYDECEREMLELATV